MTTSGSGCGLWPRAVATGRGIAGRRGLEPGGAVPRSRTPAGQIINGPMPVPGERWIVQGLDPQAQCSRCWRAKR